MTNQIQNIQPGDTTKTAVAVRNAIQKRIRDREIEEQLSREAYVRELVRLTEHALTDSPIEDVEDGRDIERVELFRDTLRAIRDNTCSSYSDIAECADISRSRITHYRNDHEDTPIDGLFRKGEVYFLTPAGEQTLTIPWREFL